MKKRNRIQNLCYGLIAVFLVLAQNSTAQNSPKTDKEKGINRISLSEYQNISIYGVKRIDIETTYGNTNKVNSLFNTHFKTTRESDPDESINFKNDTKGLYFSFVDNSDVNSNNELNYFRISNNQSTFSVKGKTIKIGDNISKLGDINIDYNDGTISFSTWKESSYIEIKFDKESKTIISITYEVFT